MMRTGVAALGALSLINLASAKPNGHHRKSIRPIRPNGIFILTITTVVTRSSTRSVRR